MLGSLTGKTILLTGAAGFIGSHLLRRLISEGDCRVLAVTRCPISIMAPNVNVVSSLESLSADVWRRSGVDRIDIVFHLGGFIPKSRAEMNQTEPVYRDNILATRALLESLPNPPQRIIFAGTVDVYATAPDGAALNESSPLAPQSLYAASKLFCEQAVKTYAADRNSAYSILRLGHIFGPGEEAYRKLIPETIRQLLVGKSPTIHGAGQSTRDFLYVTDAVEAILRSATLGSRSIGPLNIVRGESFSTASIVETAARLAERPANIEYLPEKPEAPSLRFDGGAMRAILGEWPLVSIEQGLLNEMDHFRHHHS